MAQSGDDEMGRVLVEVTISNQWDEVLAKTGTLAPAKVRRVRMEGVVDTGSTRLVLPASVVAQLGLPSAGQTAVRYASRQKAQREMVEGVRLELLGRKGTFNAIVEPDRENALIGAIVMEDLDFVVDCTTRTLRPRDPDGILSELE